MCKSFSAKELAVCKSFLRASLFKKLAVCKSFSAKELAVCKSFLCANFLSQCSTGKYFVQVVDMKITKKNLADIWEDMKLDEKSSDEMS